MITVIALLTLASCNNHAVNIPFPVSDSGYAQPVSQPLQLSAPKKLNWITTKTGGIKSPIKKLDIDALPSTPYDTLGFKPFSKPPDVVHFDFNSLADSAFNLEKIPSKSLQFKKAVLPAPVVVKSGTIVPKSGTTLSMYDIGLAQGLPDKIILCLIKDKAGFIWIGTDKGLYRYDGEYMLLYPSIEGEVSDLVEDTDGRIWYVTPRRIGMIDAQKGVVTSSAEIHIIFPQLPKMIVDEKGYIWISRIAGRGVDIIDPRNLTYKHLDDGTGLPGSVGAWGICEDSKKNIWLTTVSGVTIINPGRDKIRHLKKVNGLGSDTVQAIIGDHKGRVWIAFHNGGVSAVDAEQGIITNYGKLQGLENPLTYRLLCDNNDQVWMAGNHGLSILNTVKGASKKFSEKEGMSEDFILDLLQDDQQRVWVASYSGGLSVIEQSGEMVHPVGAKTLSTLMEDQEGRIWVGAGNTNDGIQILDNEKKLSRQLDKRHGLADNFIQNFSQINGNIWIATDGGFHIIDPKNKTIEITGKKEGLASDTVYGVLKDKRGNVWVVGPTRGIDMIDYGKQLILHAGVTEGLSEDNILDIKSDNEGKLWIATYSKGVDIIDPEKGTIQNLNQGPGLKDSCFRLLMLDDAGRMWIGTDKGVYIADTKQGSLTILTTAAGLCNNSVTSLLSYKGQVLVGTKNKVSIITTPGSPDATGAKSVTEWRVGLLAGSEGLVNNNNNWSTNIVTKKGQYLWGDLGITIINGIKEQTRTAPTYITGISVLNEPQYFTDKVSLNEHDTLWNADKFYIKGQTKLNEGSYAQQHGLHWDSVAGPYNIPVNLLVPYDLNYIQFKFGQGHLGIPDAVTYSYILEGIDKSWSSFNNKSFTDNYLNLSPGKYTFRVRSKDISGHWGKPASFSFAITPPWWQTWWMYLIYIIVLVGAIYGYNKYRSKALIKENRVLEEKVLDRTREVKQQADELATVNQISQALVSQADLNDLIQLVGNQLRDLFKANIVYIALLDKKTKIISFPYQYGDKMQPIKLGEGLTSKIILTGEPLLLNKDLNKVTATLGIDRVGLPAASYIGVPIPVSDEIIGVLSIQSTETENRFAEKDQHLLSTIAANVGVAIKKARLFEEVKQANTDADAARKSAEVANAAKSAFLSTVSHELRTPLTSVLGFTKIIKKRLEEKIFPVTDKSDPKIIKIIEQISGNLNVVIAEGERLTNLINDVLDLAKIEAGKMEWNMEAVHVPDVVERAIAATSALFDQKNLTLERKIENDLPEISGDRDKLIQVVVNLLSNAVKFTREGTVTCTVFQKDGGVVVGITDTGIGIAPEDYDKVFEQFKQVGDTLTDKPKGTGLGLPICKEIVEHHAGKIWLESELGKGSTFYFMLPSLKTDEKAVRHIQLDDLLRQLKKRMEQSHPSIQGKNATILVVDDDDGIRSLLKQELTEAGYNVEEASNGKDAISKIRAINPDLVILDVMMPEMNGFDVAAVIKNDPQTMEIPIIILSIVEDKSRGFRIGVDRYLTKPIDTALLFSEIGNLLEQGKSRKKVMVVDEDSVTVRSLTDVLQAKGYQVVESDGVEVLEKAIANQPDIIILNSLISDKHEIVKTLRFEKGLENVLFLIYQ
ncbi:MAG: two-component regulator propeller domain-containing protein [Ferruginibacter sp.]